MVKQNYIKLIYVLLTPILSMVRSWHHELTMCLNSLIGPVLKYFSTFIVKDSFEFVDKLKHRKANDTFFLLF